MAVYTGGYKNDNSVRSLRGAITYAAGSTGAVGTTTLFTVTGEVRLLSLSAICVTDLTSAGAPTFDVGIVGQTTAFVTTAPDVTGWDSGEWLNTNPGYSSLPATAEFELLANFNLFRCNLKNGQNIIQTIASATITGGVVRWYVQYIPLSGDGLITLHANLSSF